LEPGALSSSRSLGSWCRHPRSESSLARHGLGPAPRRGGTTCRQFLAQQASSMVACDFFTVETFWLKGTTFCLSSSPRSASTSPAARPTPTERGWCSRRRTWRSTSNERPTGAPVSHPWPRLQVLRPSMTCFATEGLRVVCTPFRAPRANVCCERWIRTVNEAGHEGTEFVHPSPLRAVPAPPPGDDGST
jgi:putative transposase